MKPVSPAFLTNLASSDQFMPGDLYTITLANGAGVLRYTTCDFDIIAGGNTFSATGPRFSRSKISQKIGFEVDQLEVDVLPRTEAGPDGGPDLVSGVPWMQAARLGYFDGGELQVERVFMVTPGDTTPGTVVRFAGRIGDVTFGRTAMTMTVNSHLELLSAKFPIDLYQPGCRYRLFDARCTLVKASFAAAVTVNVGATATTVPLSSAQPSGYFSQGTITFTSGANNGLSRFIRSWALGVASLLTPLPAAPAFGDTANAYPGCDRTKTTCNTKFSNQLNYGGFPFVPQPETAV